MDGNIKTAVKKTCGKKIRRNFMLGLMRHALRCSWQMQNSQRIQVDTCATTGTGADTATRSNAGTETGTGEAAASSSAKHSAMDCC